MRLALSKVEHISIALSVLAGELYWRAMDILVYSGLSRLLSVTIFDDGPDQPVSLSEVAAHKDMRICSEVFYMLAYQSRIRHLTVESIFIPRSLQTYRQPLGGNPGTSFASLYGLRTRTTADLVWSMLSLMPAVRELALDVLHPDMAGAVVRAAASLLPRLQVLKLNFWHRMSWKAERDLTALGRMSELRVLEVRNRSLAGTAPSVASPQTWRAFVRGMPRLENLWLPSTFEVKPAADGLRLIGTSWPGIRHLRLNLCVDIDELCLTGRDTLFPSLQTLSVKRLMCGGKKRYDNLTFSNRREVWRAFPGVCRSP
jgi:hypothetical protein